jgi:hypothetical protein
MVDTGCKSVSAEYKLSERTEDFSDRLGRWLMPVPGTLQGFTEAQVKARSVPTAEVDREILNGSYRESCRSDPG